MNLSAIKSRLEAATPGNWELEDGTNLIWGKCYEEGINTYGSIPVASIEGKRDWSKLPRTWEEVRADAEFITHSKSDITFLLKEVERYREELTKIANYETDCEPGYTNTPFCRDVAKAALEDGSK